MQQREHALQRMIVAALRWNNIPMVETDIMNGLKFLGKDTKKRMAFIQHHRALGWSKGIPDLIIALRNGETLWVELKDGDNNNPTKEQKDWINKLKSMGHNAVVWRTIDDALEFIKGYKTMILKGGLDGSAKDDNKRAFDLNERLASQEQADGRPEHN